MNDLNDKDMIREIYETSSEAYNRAYEIKKQHPGATMDYGRIYDCEGATETEGFRRILASDHWHGILAAKVVKDADGRVIAKIGYVW